MRRTFLVTLALTAVISLSLFVPVPPAAAAPQAGGPRKLALLVGIGEYERGRAQPPDWWNLASRADVEAMKAVLLQKFDFLDTDVMVLTDKQATRIGIETAFKTHLIAQAKPGSIVLFHFSGHGQQVLDDNRDELDGLDESLVPYDYVSQSAADGAKTNLRDDALGDLLKDLQTQMSVNGRVQGSIAVTLDSCFSGTATRLVAPEGRVVHRGRGWMAEFDGPLPALAVGAQLDSGSGLLTRGAAASQGYVLLTASSHDQLACQWTDPDGRTMGAFTMFLIEALKQATPRTTYRSLFERLNADVVSRLRAQNPQLEGLADSLLFSGTASPRQPYIVVEKVDGDTVTLPAGEVHGVTIGTVYHLYKPGGDVAKPADKVAEATVAKVLGASSEAVLTEPFRGKLDAAMLQAARALEVERAYGETRVRLLEAQPLPPELKAEVAGLKAVTTEGVTADNFDVRISRDKTRNTVLVLEGKAAVFARIDTTTADAPRRLRDALLSEWRARFLLRLQNLDDDPLVRVDLRLVPVTPVLNGVGEVSCASVPRGDFAEGMGQTQLALEDGEYFRLEVRNRSTGIDAYVTVLHFGTSGRLCCEFPVAEENKIRADGKWKPLGERYVYRARAPKDAEGSAPARETFKAIATREASRYNQVLPQCGVGAPPPSEGIKLAAGRLPGHDVAVGKPAPVYDLGRLLASAAIGEDADPRQPGQRQARVPIRVTDWNTSSVSLETRPPRN